MGWMSARRRGFSLLELMVTIAVVGIIASIGVVSVQAVTQRGKSQSTLQSTAATFRALRDRARLSNTSLILTPNTTPAGINGRVNITAIPRPCAGPPLPVGCATAPDGVLDLGDGVDLFAGRRMVCIDRSGAIFKTVGDCDGFVKFDVTVRFPETVGVGTCSNCVVLRRDGMVDVVGPRAISSGCVVADQCGGAACRSGRCVPPEGLEHPGDFGAAYEERR
jgi:prepilin-type N-terminal cleavage/methylation domain-containing protein